MEDDKHLRIAMRGALGEGTREIVDCSTVSEAKEILARWWPDLAIIDYKLPDGTAPDLLELLSKRAPLPKLIVMSSYARPEETFDLGRYGVRGYLQKPFRLEDLREKIRNAMSAPPEVINHIKNVVGYESLKHLETKVRNVMVEEALQRSSSLRGAARLLSISRESLQHILRKSKKF